MKVRDVEIGSWFYLDKQWYKLLYVGRKNVKAKQIGNPKQYTFSVDTEVRPK